MGQETKEREYNDHDLLVKLHENVKLNFEQIRRDIRDLQDGTADRIAAHDRELRNLREEVDGIERWKSAMKVYLAIYGVAGGFLAALLIEHLSK